MGELAAGIGKLNDLVCGSFLLFSLIGAGIYLMAGLEFMSLRRIGYALRQRFKGRKGGGEGDISQPVPCADDIAVSHYWCGQYWRCGATGKWIKTGVMWAAPYTMSAMASAKNRKSQIPI